MDMTVCYAYEYPTNSGGDEPCAGCGHYYWEHSHYLDWPYGRRQCRRIITKYDAMSVYDFYHACGEPGADVRDRYQMMMDRTPGVCEWVERVSARQFKDLKPPFVEMHSLNRERYDEDGNRLPERSPGSTKVWPFPPGTPIKQNFGTYVPTTYNPYQGGVIPDAELQAHAEAMAGISHPLTYEQAAEQTEPVEITTWGDMMNRNRRWLLPDGTNYIEPTYGKRP